MVKKNVVTSLSSFLVSLLFLAGMTTSLSAAAYDPDQERVQSFVTTEEISTETGSAHLEVQSTEIRSESDLRAAGEEIIERVRRESKNSKYYRLNVTAEGTGEPQQAALEHRVEASLAELESSIPAENLRISKELKVEKPRESFLKRHYNLTLTVIRFVANTATISVGLVLGKHVPVEHATMIGVLAGTFSGAIQLNSKRVFKWLSDSVFFVNLAKKAGLIKNADSPQTGERILKEAEMYGRWATLEAGFLLVCQTAMRLLNIPISENLFITTAKSTASQGIYEVGVLKASRELERINPNWADKAAIFRNVAPFGGSALSVLSAIGTMIGIPYSNLGFVFLTGAGLVLNFSPKLMRTKPVEKILNRWRGVDAVPLCRSLFAYL